VASHRLWAGELGSLWHTMHLTPCSERSQAQYSAFNTATLL
jgi:hypothetical protein